MKVLEPEEFAGYETPVFLVSEAAKVEKDAKWREVSGWAYGDARVNGADWQAIYSHQMNRYEGENTCPAFHIKAVTPDGKIAHFGSIERCRYDASKVVLAA